MNEEIKTHSDSDKSRSCPDQSLIKLFDLYVLFDPRCDYRIILVTPIILITKENIVHFKSFRINSNIVT